jgi:hypothetical protein
MNIYPVSAQEKVTIDLNTDTESATLQVFNSTGTLVLEKTYFGEQKTELNELPNGNYLAILKSANGQIIKKKFLVLGSN